MRKRGEKKQIRNEEKKTGNSFFSCWFIPFCLFFSRSVFMSFPCIFNHSVSLPWSCYICWVAVQPYNNNNNTCCEMQLYQINTKIQPMCALTQCNTQQSLIRDGLISIKKKQPLEYVYFMAQNHDDESNHNYQCNTSIWTVALADDECFLTWYFRTSYGCLNLKSFGSRCRFFFFDLLSQIEYRFPSINMFCLHFENKSNVFHM